MTGSRMHMTDSTPFDENDYRRLRDPRILESKIGVGATQKPKLVEEYEYALERAHGVLSRLYPLCSTRTFVSIGRAYFDAFAEKQEREQKPLDLGDTEGLDMIVHDALEHLTRNLRGDGKYDVFAAQMGIGKYDPAFSDDGRVSRKRQYVMQELAALLRREMPDLEERHIYYYSDPRTADFERRYRRAKQDYKTQHHETRDDAGEVLAIATSMLRSIKRRRARIAKE